MSSVSQPTRKGPAHELHLKPKEIAKVWGCSESTAQHMFENEPGVLKLGSRDGRRRTRVGLRVPLSVMERVHKRLSGQSAEEKDDSEEGN